jgi:anaerobic ribonucleoside-triphosphate reductase
MSRVEQDKEVFDFINGLDRYHTIKELRELISRRFGKARTPSKSSLGRFLRKITKEYSYDKGGERT